MSKDFLYTQPIFPIVPFFNEDETLNVDNLKSYLKFLTDNGVKNLMTTAGTSQFNLLSLEEIKLMNCAIVDFTKDKGCNVIIGFPEVDLVTLEQTIDYFDEKYINRDDISYMFLYPERFYNEGLTMSYFYNLANRSEKSCWIHGMPLRKATGGTYDMTPGLLNALFDHPNINGIKEENSSYKSSFDLISGVDNTKGIICVAGGDQRKFALTECVGANTFLTGVGNIIPSLDIDFMNSYFGIEECFTDWQTYVKHAHTPIYNTFCKFGWHKSLRIALKLEGLDNGFDRYPWPSTNCDEKKLIEKTLKDVKESFILEQTNE